MPGRTHHPDYVAVWLWLLALMLASLLVSFLPIPGAVATALIFGMAGVKALLVALYFMHLRFEQVLLAALPLVPLLLLAVLVLVLLPEFVFG